MGRGLLLGELVRCVRSPPGKRGEDRISVSVRNLMPEFRLFQPKSAAEAVNAGLTGIGVRRDRRCQSALEPTFLRARQLWNRPFRNALPTNLGLCHQYFNPRSLRCGHHEHIASRNYTYQSNSLSRGWLFVKGVLNTLCFEQ